MVTIRTATIEDAEAVARLHVRAWQRAYAGIMPADFLTGLDPADWARRRRAGFDSPLAKIFTTLVAVADETPPAHDASPIVGFTTVGPYRENQQLDHLDRAVGEILAMYVDPVSWGAGVGRALMAAALAELTGRRGFAEVRLWVLAENAQARRFYERAGLVPDGHRSTYQVKDGHLVPEIRYHLRRS
jgi:GNAT superfamily N-acetyltransferase